MPNIKENLAESTDETTMIELDATLVAAVAGGINPQPLPPRHDLHLD